MRKFTAGLAIDPKTFAPVVQIVLGGVNTDVLVPLAPLMDYRAIHGEEAEQEVIDNIMAELQVKENLTEAEYTHYRDNFRTLIVPLPGK